MCVWFLLFTLYKIVQKKNNNINMFAVLSSDDITRSTEVELESVKPHPLSPARGSWRSSSTHLALHEVSFERPKLTFYTKLLYSIKRLKCSIVWSINAMVILFTLEK